MENLTDEQLIEQAKAGNMNALDCLMNRYKVLASKVARSYFLVGAEYEDLLQEAMIGLYKAYLNYDKNSKASFSTFARTCITRNVQTAIKTANRKKNQILNNSVSLSSQGGILTPNENEEDEITLIIPSNALGPDEKLIESEKLMQIKENIKKSLSKLELNVLALYLAGFSYVQIAHRLQMSAKSIDNALSRIKRKLSYLKDKK